MPSLAPFFATQFFDNSGLPLAAGKLYTYISGTTTNKTTYQDQAGATPHANPIVLDAAGRPPGGTIWLGAGEYTFTLNTSADVLVKTWDDVGRPDSNAVTFTQAGSGAVERTVQDKLREVVSVKDFGADGDGVTDDTAAISAAVAAIKASGGAKWLYFPPGSYVTTQTTTLDAVGLKIFGAGGGGNTKSGGSAGVLPTASNDGATQIIGDFTGSPVIRISAQGCSVDDMTVSRSASAYGAAFAVANAGILVSPPDAVGYQTARQSRISRVRVMNQPGDGILYANDVVGAVAEFCEVNCVKGAAYMVAGGSYLGYTNRARPGIINLISCTSAWTGGHGLRVGGGAAEVDNSDIPYRVVAINHEAFYNCTITANCVSSPAVANAYVSGENHTLIDCAFDGRVEFPSGAPTHAALVLRGNNLRFSNTRLIQCTTPAAYAIGPAAGGGAFSRGLVLDDLYVVNSSQGANYFDPVVSVSSGVRGISVTCNQPDTASGAAIVKLTSRLANTNWSEDFNGVAITERQKQIVAGGSNSGYAAPAIITIDDDKAGYFEWDGLTKGTLILSGNVSAADSAIVAFRVGSSGFVTSLAVGANVEVGTGTLAGTTGTDTKLTIRADTATNRVYIENRRGATYAWAAVFVATNTNSPGVGILSEFVNLA